MVAVCPNCGSKKFDVAGEGYICKKCNTFFDRSVDISRFQVFKRSAVWKGSKKAFKKGAEKTGEYGWRTTKRAAKYVPRKTYEEARQWKEERKARKEEIKAIREKARAEKEAARAARRKERGGPGVLSTILLLIVLGYLGFVGYKLYQGGSLQDLFTGVRVIGEETGVAEEAGFNLKKIFSYILDPNKLVRDVGTFKGTQAIPIAEEKIALSVKSFSPRKDLFSVGQNIILDGELVVEKIDKDLELVFDCDLENENKGSVDVSGSTDNRIFLGEGDEGSYFFKCIIPTDKLRVDGSKGFRANLKVGFDNTVKSFLRFATSSDKSLRVRSEVSRYDGGPINLGMSFKDKQQPFSGGRTYFFNIRLRNDKQVWNGEMNLDSLGLIAPEGSRIAHEYSLEGVAGDLCEFFEEGNLKGEVVDNINNNKPLGSSLFEESVDLLDKDDVTIPCELELDEITTKDIQYKILSAEASYNYVIKKYVSVKVEGKTTVSEEKDVDKEIA